MDYCDGAKLMKEKGFLCNENISRWENMKQNVKK